MIKSLHQFKIDLIVWKYGKVNKNTLTSIEFKIDLIVWKYVNCWFRDFVYRAVFKIDLIVWK